MGFIANMSLVEWVIMFVVFIVAGVAYWLVDDSRKWGIFAGGKACDGYPHYCQMNRNYDGAPKPSPDVRRDIEET